MKLLIVTQAVDTEDQVLGFFHAWIIALAARVESVIVICLKEGTHQLPDNVRVYSLGKEKGKVSPAQYAIRFFLLAWKLRAEYDRVFVHMNQEYLLIAGWLWKLLGKPVYMWRNHLSGSWMTDLAALFCTKIFCTSKHSYTARFKKTMLMPVGIDLTRFTDTEEGNLVRTPGSILFLGRMAPVKRPGILLEALAILKEKGANFTATLMGSPLPEHEVFLHDLRNEAQILDLGGLVRFFPGIPNADTPEVYRAHDIYVNTTRSGAFDKTLFEAAASGCFVVAASDDFAASVGPEVFFNGTAKDLAIQLESALSLSLSERTVLTEKLKKTVEANSLNRLTQALAEAIY